MVAPHLGGSGWSQVPFEINGKMDLDTLRIRAGRKCRVRLIALQNEFPYINVALTARANSAFTVVTDEQVAEWTPVAKDGADLPAAFMVPRPATQRMSMGETYDFAFVPARAGSLRLELRLGAWLAVRTLIVVYSWCRSSGTTGAGETGRPVPSSHPGWTVHSRGATSH